MWIFSYKNTKLVLKDFSWRSPFAKNHQASTASLLLVIFLIFFFWASYIFLVNKKSSLEIEIETTQAKLEKMREKEQLLKIELGKILSLSNFELIAQKNHLLLEKEPQYLSLSATSLSQKK